MSAVATATPGLTKQQNNLGKFNTRDIFSPTPFTKTGWEYMHTGTSAPSFKLSCYVWGKVIPKLCTLIL